ncbi:hypothetical protein GH714_033537 [Hevea brasiliensis]|uniref:Uncharacterized protein n=1 Tax=Hevea brasiliensis TaxID=3981 RepID=A0A6A6NDW5_HEVBR|nr:hypothetical protein GH714_033537 [Hevea brasiliensis]
MQENFQPNVKQVCGTEQGLPLLSFYVSKPCLGAPIALEGAKVGNQVNRVLKSCEKSRTIVHLWGLYLKLSCRRMAKSKKKSKKSTKNPCLLDTDSEIKTKNKNRTKNPYLLAIDNEISRMNKLIRTKPKFSSLLSPHKEATVTLQLVKDLSLTFDGTDDEVIEFLA